MEERRMVGKAVPKGEEERGKSGAPPAGAPPEYGRSSLDSGLVPQDGPQEARTHRLLVATGCVLCVALAAALAWLR
jgi:hypothetical protein